MLDVQTVPYVVSENDTLYYDLFRPKQFSAPLPVVLCIHGGGWVSGDRSYMHDVAIPLAEVGFAAVCPQYRFAPTHRYPAAVDDIASCIAFLRKSALEYGLDPNRIATLGNSSGGHLAAIAGLTCDLQGVVDISGVSDLTDPEHDHFSIGASFVYEFMGALPQDAPELYRQASPITHITPQSPPFLVIHGEEDDIVPIDQSLRLVNRLRENHVETEYHSFPGEAHSFTYSSWHRIETTYIAFLQRVLNHDKQNH